jgi:SAM-dependent methyltransferase
MENELIADYWDDRYKKQQTGWDLGISSPPLTAYFDQLVDKNISILIPGCGNAHEAAYLLKKGFQNITIIDISSTVVEKLKKQFAGTPLKIELVDFFAYAGQFDLIIEQTFFCAIRPTQRNAYVNKIAELLKFGGKLVGLLFDTIFEKPGPPFGGSTSEYRALFEGKFIISVLDLAYNSIKPRQNTEVFINFRKKI